MAELFGTDQLFDARDFLKLVSRLSLDVAVVGLLVVGAYLRRHRNRDHVFTLVAINVVTFLICFTLRNVNIELGFALGLFAVFGILRYRTEPVSIRDLTYLFLAIGIAILTAVGFNKKTSLLESFLADAAVVCVAALLESFPLGGRGGSRPVLYDQIALLAPGRERELHADLAARTGLGVESVHVERLDLLRDAAEITIHFRDAPATEAAHLGESGAARNRAA
jgi:hypothetical protein